MVATVLTVYGIETLCLRSCPLDISPLQQYLPFTVLKPIKRICLLKSEQLQQYLPFTVLKLEIGNHILRVVLWLQQYLPFTVLKPIS